MDGEVGRFKFVTHSAFGEDTLKYNTAIDLFPELKGKELYRTVGFKDIAMIHGDTDKSYRKTAKLLNRIRHQEKEGTPYRTLQENTEKEGSTLLDYVEEKTKCLLKNNGFTDDGICLKINENYNDEAKLLSEEIITVALTKCLADDVRDEVRSNPVCYEDPEHTVNISIDDVLVKRQEMSRNKIEYSEKGKRKYVHNTVTHISKGEQSYTLNGHGIKKVLCFVIGFIFNNELIGKRLQFFTDGHTTLNEAIIKCFSWLKNIGIILDWYHLVKKCKEQLSMAMKGRKVRNKTLGKLLPLLWQGLTDKAITLLEDIEDIQVKDKTKIIKLVDYLHRNKTYIPCYAMRKQLGLRNSSNIGEKMNDLLVSSRQKHNGMSWSKQGSVALASVTALKRNNEAKKWFEEEELEFKLVANSAF